MGKQWYKIVYSNWGTERRDIYEMIVDVLYLTQEEAAEIEKQSWSEDVGVAGREIGESVTCVPLDKRNDYGSVVQYTEYTSYADYNYCCE